MAQMADEDENYVCSLDEKSLARAQKELNEDPANRLGAVKALREWARQQKWLKTPTDTKFLLAFLRARKFSQLGARELLTNFWTIRTKIPEWFSKTSPADPVVQEIFRSGFYVIMPGRDNDGRKFSLERMGYIDMSEFKKKKRGVDELMRGTMLMMDTFLLDENVQVNGHVMLSDGTGVTAKHEMFFGFDSMKKMMEVWQDGYPARYKAFHIYNIGPVYEAILNLIKPFMKKKFQQRMIVHGRSLVDVYRQVDMSMLPDEYLPDDYQGPRIGSVQSICESMVTEYMKPEIKDYICELSSPRNGYGVDLKLKAQSDVPAQSYVKLNV